MSFERRCYVVYVHGRWLFPPIGGLSPPTVHVYDTKSSWMRRNRWASPSTLSKVGGATYPKYHFKNLVVNRLPKYRRFPFQFCIIVDPEVHLCGSALESMLCLIHERVMSHPWTCYVSSMNVFGVIHERVMSHPWTFLVSSMNVLCLIHERVIKGCVTKL